MRQAEAGDCPEAHVFHIQEQQEFHELEELGAAPPPVCLKCRGYRECTFRRKRLTQAEQEVVMRVEKDMNVDVHSGIITAKYPWKNCVGRLVDNRRQAERIQATMERHMIEVGTHGGYVAEMMKSIKEGKVRRLSRDEMDSWHGPVHFITTFAVIKPESVSTKTRVVANSAMKNARAKLSLNECMYQGPNALCDLLDCLVFWRSIEVALMADLKKAYQAIHTGPMELHLRRLLFREDPVHPWEVFAFTRATFGDVAAGLVLEVAKRRVAELGVDLDKKAAQQLQDFTYVDDSILGGTPEEAQRMRGERVGDTYTGTIPRILARGDMKVKFIAMSGSDDLWEAEQLAGKTLGVFYRLKQDEIYFTLTPSFYEAKQKSTDQARVQVVLSATQVQEMRQGCKSFSRRQALSMVMGLYDPLGLVSPALVRGKLLLRRLYAPTIKGGWDADLPTEEKRRWAEWFDSLLIPAEATFPRSTKPKEAVGQPRIVGFGDASLSAMCAVVYIVWGDRQGRYHSRILTAKCRVSPLVGTTVPRGELQAIVMLHRMILAVVEAFPYRARSISTYTDSLCSVGAIGKPGSSLRPFFRNRVLEIIRTRQQLQEFTEDLAPVSHIPGEENPADVGTRGSVGIVDLGPGSIWQLGPDFIQKEYGSWPRTTAIEGSRLEVPGDECAVATSLVMTATAVQEVGVFRTLLDHVGSKSALGTAVQSLADRALAVEKLEKTARTLARVIGAVVQGDRQACGRHPTVKLVEIAVRILLKSASQSAVVALQAGKLRGLGAEEKCGTVWVRGRIRGEQMATLLGTTALPVLLPGEALAKSIMARAHREDHRRGPRDAAARSRKAAWIMAATRLAKTIAAKCAVCRYHDKRMERQLMGQLPVERLEVVAPFESAALDLFGPFWVTDPAKGRRRFKCWVVAYVCMGAKAVCLLACPGYGTEDFMTTHRYFTGMFGRPRILYTDHAPSLVKAAETPDWAEIATMVGGLGTEWRLTAKGCSWRNGLAERVIRSARHTLGHELTLGQTLDFHQFGAVLAVVSAIINARPLSLRVSVEGEYHALAPRDILFGRASRVLG